MLCCVLALAACEHGGSGQAIDGGDRLCGAVLCASTEFCDFSTNTCGSGVQETARCKPLVRSCGDLFGSVCGCDGRMYDTPCDAYTVGVDLDANGNCPLAAGDFTCGFRQCSLTGEYCLQSGSASGGYSNASFLRADTARMQRDADVRLLPRGLAERLPQQMQRRHDDRHRRYL